jgi:hypothetical protein
MIGIVPEKIFVISAHGRIAPRMFLVPENTYIMSLAPSGKGSAKVKFEIDNWIYAKHGKRADMKAKLMKSLEAGTFLSDYWHSATAGAVHTPESLAIYEPGDIMTNSELMFNNDFRPIFLMGMYEFPLAYDLKQKIFAANRGLYTENANINSLTWEDMNANAVNKGITTQIDKNLDNIFIRDDNLVIGHTETMRTIATPTEASIEKQVAMLSDLIKLPIVGGGGAGAGAGAGAAPIRLFIVDSCRSSTDLNLQTKSRRMSLMSRRTMRVDEPSREESRLSIDYLQRIAVPLRKKLDTDRSPKLTATYRMLTTIITNLQNGKTVGQGELLTALADSSEFVKLREHITSSVTTLRSLPLSPLPSPSS